MDPMAQMGLGMMSAPPMGGMPMGAPKGKPPAKKAPPKTKGKAKAPPPKAKAKGNPFAKGKAKGKR